MLPSCKIARIAQVQRLGQDLGLNLVGAAMVLALAQEFAQLRAQLEVYRSIDRVRRICVKGLKDRSTIVISLY